MDARSLPPSDELTLADRLAQMRTLLAIERTMLAYVRSSLAIIIAGVTLIQFFQHPAFQWGGVVLVPTGAAMLIFGLRRYKKLRERVLTGKTFITEINEPDLDTEE